MIPLPPTPPSSSTLFDWCRKVAGLINQLITRQTFTQLATAPTDPRPGDGWFDTGSNTAYIWDGTTWVAATGGGGGGGGTVTSVAATVPTGFSITGSPITTSGTLAISYSAGYQGYTSAEASKLAGIAPGATANTGTVTSAAMTVPTGFSLSGSPITTSGTFALTYAAGYQGYTSTEATKLAGIAPGATANTGTVTSVAATVPTGLSIAGSPVTSSGTLAITYTAGYQGYTTVEAAKVAGAATLTGVETLTNKSLASPVMNSVPSSAWGVDFAPSSSVGNYITIANGATYDLAAGAGLIGILEDSGIGAAMFFAAYGTVNVVSQIGTLFTVTSGTASKVNVYYNGAGKYRIQNLSGGSLSFFVSAFRMRTGA